MFNFSIQCARRAKYITKAFIIFYAFVFLTSFFSTGVEIIKADSSSTSVTIVANSPPPSGGGGGAPIPPPVASVAFSGRAYPERTVTLLKDAQVAATTVAGLDANFQINLSGLSPGNYIFSIYSEDSKGKRSSLFTFPISVAQGATTKIGGIFIAPTIDIDKSEVKKGDNIAIFGQSVPQASITISVNSENEFFGKADSDNSGVYLYNFDTSVLEMGKHFTKSKAAIEGEISSFSQTVSFAVGAKTIDKNTDKCSEIKADSNCDGRVNLVDFSIMAYWYSRPSPPNDVDLNNDYKIDLVDFSIMAYYWTG
ncbi:MAG: hypothetical protein U9N04_03835 [Patescibacteria group bacterium]|nr:hypothetical protein [Patescibacteria group bacterium]